MTSARLGRGVAVAAIAIALAGGGAAVNLRLIEAHDQRAEPLGLASAITSTTASATTSTTAAPPPTTTTQPTTASTVPPATTPNRPATTTSHPVGEAGTVMLAVDGGVLRVVSVQVTSGWTYETKRESGDEVELEFRRASDGSEASFHARLEDDGLRVEIEDEGPDD